MGKPTRDATPTGPEPEKTKAPLAWIDRGPARSVRAKRDEKAVREYAETPDQLPRVHCAGFENGDGAKLWCFDGEHRCGGWELAGWADVPVLVWWFPTAEEAERFARTRALKANAQHNALRRTNEDKEQTVKAALLMPWNAELSDRQIADLCLVTHPMIRRVREELSHNGGIAWDSPAHARHRGYLSGAGPRPGYAHDGRGGVTRTCPKRTGEPDGCVGTAAPEWGCDDRDNCEYRGEVTDTGAAPSADTNARPDVEAVNAFQAATPDPPRPRVKPSPPSQVGRRQEYPPPPPPPPPAARPDRPRPDRYREPPPPPPENERLAERVASALQSLKAVLGVINEVIDSPFAALVADAAGRTGTKLEAAGSRLDARLGPVEIRTRLMTTPEIVTLADLLCDVKAGLLRDSPREVRAPWERSPTPDAEPDADPTPAADPGPFTAVSPVARLDLPPDTLREILEAGITTVGELAAVVGTERRFGLDDDELERLCIVLEPFMPPDADKATWVVA